MQTLSKLEKLTQCWFDVGPLSTMSASINSTLVQHPVSWQEDKGSICQFCCSAIPVVYWLWSGGFRGMASYLGLKLSVTGKCGG